MEDLFHQEKNKIDEMLSKIKIKIFMVNQNYEMKSQNHGIHYLITLTKIMRFLVKIMR